MTSAVRSGLRAQPRWRNGKSDAVITPNGDASLQHLHDETPTANNRLGFTDLLLGSGAPAATTGAKIFQCPGSTPNSTAFAAGILSYAYLNTRGRFGVPLSLSMSAPAIPA